MRGTAWKNGSGRIRRPLMLLPGKPVRCSDSRSRYMQQSSGGVPVRNGLFLRCGSFGRHGEIFAEQNKKLIQQNASAQLGKTDTGEGEPAQLCQKSAEFFDFREVVLI